MKIQHFAFSHFFFRPHNIESNLKFTKSASFASTFIAFSLHFAKIEIYTNFSKAWKSMCGAPKILFWQFWNDAFFSVVLHGKSKVSKQGKWSWPRRRWYHVSISILEVENQVSTYKDPFVIRYNLTNNPYSVTYIIKKIF